MLYFYGLLKKTYDFFFFCKEPESKSLQWLTELLNCAIMVQMQLDNIQWPDVTVSQ